MWLVSSSFSSKNRSNKLQKFHDFNDLFLIRFDANLSEKGVQEAESGGKALKDAGYTFDIAHTSLLTRAQVTLGKVLDAIDQKDLPIEKTWRLNERHYGGK